MNRFSKAILLLLTIVALVGCGGGGTSTPNPFAGDYSGVWWASGYPNEGDCEITIGTDGLLSGNVTDNYSESYDGTIRGRVSTNGRFDVQIQYPGYPTSYVSGTFSFSQTGALVGNGSQRYSNGTIVPINFELERN